MSSSTQKPPIVTTTTQEAQAVLAHMLAKIKEKDSKYHDRYAEWIDAQDGLETFLFRCVRPEVWKCLQTGCKNLDACKGIGGDIRFEGRGVYIDGVLGLDKRVRIYIGQSFHLRTRIAQHWNFRYRRDNPSLHYHALQQSIFNTFGILATLPAATPGNKNHLFPGMDCPDLTLNILEMWFCLLFRSLPPQLLEEWMPVGVGKEWRGEEPMALNIAIPLDTGSKSPRTWLDLNTNTDPVVLGYLENRNRRRSDVDYVHKSQQQARRPSQDRAEEVKKAYREGQKAYQKEMETRKKGDITKYQKPDPVEMTWMGATVIGMCCLTVVGIVWLQGSKGGGLAPTGREIAPKPRWKW